MSVTSVLSVQYHQFIHFTDRMDRKQFCREILCKVLLCSEGAVSLDSHVSEREVKRVGAELQALPICRERTRRAACGRSLTVFHAIAGQPCPSSQEGELPGSAERR